MLKLRCQPKRTWKLYLQLWSSPSNHTSKPNWNFVLYTLIFQTHCKQTLSAGKIAVNRTPQIQSIWMSQRTLQRPHCLDLKIRDFGFNRQLARLMRMIFRFYLQFWFCKVMVICCVCSSGHALAVWSEQWWTQLGRVHYSIHSDFLTQKSLKESVAK